ncbi:MAG TPA: sodium:solute symporter family protein [Tepidisphaeraceae bacterium]|jgi:SSS family solute:Na+ symporter
MTGVDYAIVIGFLTVMALAGLWISRLIKDSDDFFVAGRELTPFILAATITATNLSMLHFIGMGGIAHKNGIPMIWQNWTGNIALVLSGIFILPIMRRLRIRSIPELLEMRYSRGLRTLVGAFWGLRLCVFLGILLYVAATAAMTITGWNNYIAWLLIFSLVSIIYSVVGGAWAVAIMDSVQFVVMLAGGLIVFPIAMKLAGGLPSMIEYFNQHKPQQITLVQQTSDFNWLFITSILLLGFKWSTIDQAILQRAFGARSPRVGAQAMILSAIITTPMTFLWILPGVALARVHPEPFATPDHAIPWLLSTQLPAIGKGLLGFVLCGLVAAQISTITADVNSVATLFTSDVYRTLKRREPTQRQLLFVVRVSSLACGLLMLLVAFGLQFTSAGAVNVNLAVVGILDMPLFIITVVYGLTWRRMNWQGATAGFVFGGAAGMLCYAFFDASFARKFAPIVSSSTALLVTPIVSFLTRRSEGTEVDRIFSSIGRGDLDEGDVRPFHLFPESGLGKLGALLVVLGLVVFLVGVFSGAWAFSRSGTLAVAGMLMVLVGGLFRVYSD